MNEKQAILNQTNTKQDIEDYRIFIPKYTLQNKTHLDEKTCRQE